MKKKLETPFQTGIKAFLERMGLSQRKLAERIGRSNMAVSQWCLGIHEPKVGDLHVLIKEGMTAAELFGEDVAKNLFENADKAQVSCGNSADGIRWTAYSRGSCFDE